MGGRTLLFAGALAVLFALLSIGSSAEGVISRCMGTEEAGVCWLRGSHTGAYITWTFSDVPPGARLVLEFAALGDDPSATCRGRDVNLYVYIGEPGSTDWQRLDVRLRNTSLECGAYAYPLGATVPFTRRGSGGTMLVRTRQAVECEPHVGFDDDSLTLGEWGTPEPEPERPPSPDPPAPPEPEPVEPEPEEPELVEEECVLAGEMSCWVGSPLDMCPGLDPFEVDERETLPETHGPQDAPRLSPGHYRGSLGSIGPRGRVDMRDWYRLDTGIGEGYVIWFDADPGLTYDVYIVDVCGVVQHRLEGGQGAIYCVSPCIEPERGDTCGWYLRIDRKSGQGEYRLSLFSEEVEL
ncbi:MAG: hypothetical protein R6U88_07150 [Candidatus Bipolaricaulota bacterium]